MTMAAGRAARPRPNPEPQLEPARRLRAVAPLRRVPRLPFLLLTLGAILAAVLGLVSLNVNVNQ